MRLSAGIGVLLLSGVQAFALSGTVKDGQGAAISGAKVTLASDTSISATTNAAGTFTIDEALSVFDRNASGAHGQSITGAAVHGDQIRFHLARSASAGSVTLFTGKGQRQAEWPLGTLEAGERRIDLPRLAPGLYFLRIRLDGFSAEARLLQTGQAALLSPPTGHETARSASEMPLARTAATAAVDTLITKKAGFTTKKTSIDSYGQTGVAIVLSADSPLPAVTDYSATGPFQTVTETGKGPEGAYTIIRPSTLGENGFLHAPLTFGPGINMQVSQLSNLLQRIASHGFVIIARPLNGGPGDAENRRRMIDGLDWLIEQNTQAGIYQGKLAVDRAVAMGYSVGATCSIEIGGHEALATLVAIHGHEAEGELHTPVLMIGGTNDVRNGESWLAPSFEASQVQTFFGLVQGAGHGYIQESVNGIQGGVETPAIIAWIRYWVYNDQGAKHYFYGDDCVMCKAPWAPADRKHWE